MAAQTAQPSRTFRVFVSSTFEDLKAERDALQRYVFPRLADLCATRNARLQAIDLRWGVSEEASLDQRAIPICLTEIERCQRLTPRPNFIVLLGDRYGWRPLPASIDAEEFTAIRANVAEQDASLLAWAAGQAPGAKGWYRLDENAVPPQYVLRRREVAVAEAATAEQRKAAQDAEHRGWAAVEARLRGILLEAIGRLGWPEDDPARRKYVASATEQEIVLGALKPDRAAENVFCFFRSIRSMPADENAKGFCDLEPGPGGLAVDTDAKARLGALKASLSALLGDHVLPPYQAAWTGTGITTGHICQYLFRLTLFCVAQACAELVSSDCHWLANAE